MLKGIKWRNAILISLVVNSILVISLGGMVAYLATVTPKQEQYMELELTQANISDNDSSKDTPLQSQQNPSKNMYFGESEPQLLNTQSTSAGNLSVIQTEGSIDANDTKAEGIQVKGFDKSIDSSGDEGNNNQQVKTVYRSGGIRPPRVLARVEPRYPEQARRAGMQGTVVLRIQILKTGLTGSISVSRSCGYDILDEAAANAISQWTFVPAEDSNTGESIGCYVTLPISFRFN